ncbi:MXAN_6640 family putative metalloprotease [Saccharicrinis aurantiacus]|uniref:MXAN_6640 family putative metalloprotease n=1 Tax=Saccharicrinis aurantiacus TaxID=1849719 RepID=UPI000839665F|nr:MXAN_6640 family putative metalloprotease [Saccharicrinis aurantiacus]
MKTTLTLLLLLISIVHTQSYAQDIEFSNQLVERYNKHLNNAQLKSTEQQSKLWLTPLLKEAQLNWDKLTPKAQEVFSVYNNAPSFSGTELTFESGIFTFHYTIDSDDPSEDVDPTDDDDNGVPDYIDNMASVFVDKVFDEYHSTMTYTVPPNVDIANGTGTYHVYVSGKAAGEWVYGYVSSGDKYTDNHNSIDIVERYSYGSHMVMRNNYQGFGNTATQEENALKVTAAHEYMHAIQFGIAATMDGWFFEACAAWSEEVVYPGIDDNFQYMPFIFFSTDVALNYENGEDPDDDTYDGHWYGSWLFIQYLSEQFGNEIVKSIYNTSINYYTLNAIDIELSTNYSTSLKEMFIKFHVANAVLKDNADFSPYNYSRAGDYYSYLAYYSGYSFASKAYENGANYLNFSGQEIEWISNVDGNNQLMRLSADYFSLVASKPFKVKLKASSSLDNMQLVLVKIHYGADPQKIEVVYADEYNEVIVNDYDSWQGFFPLVIRIDEEVETIEPFNYSLVINSDLQSLVKYNENSEIKIAPNPINNLLNVYGTKTTDVVVSLTNMTGVEVLRSSLMDNSINVSDLSNGMYFLSVFENSQLVSIKKVIISHH